MCCLLPVSLAQGCGLAAPKLLHGLVGHPEKLAVRCRLFDANKCHEIAAGDCDFNVSCIEELLWFSAGLGDFFLHFCSSVPCLRIW